MNLCQQDQPRRVRQIKEKMKHTGVANWRRSLFADSAALWIPSATVDGWIPIFNNSWQAPSMAPARTVTVVVPSPASTS